MKILLLGATGFIGRELGIKLVASGHQVQVVTRRPKEVSGLLPFPCQVRAFSGGMTLAKELIAESDAVVNLLGEGIADKPWTKRRRAAIVGSRTESVAALTEAVKSSPKCPKVIVQASAIGYYGSRGDEELDEASTAGQGFLSETCQAWEEAAKALASLVPKLVTLRIGMVLGLAGGALPKLTGIYAKGLGSTLGSGRQWMSWIHVDDLTSMITAALTDDGWSGTYNAVAPMPCTNRDFDRALADIGRFWGKKPAPALALRVVMGKRASLALDSVRVLPRAAIKQGFVFAHPTMGEALAALYGDQREPHARDLVTKQWLPVALDQLWPFFADPANLERLTPPWLAFKVVSVSPPQIGRGTRITYQLRLHGVSLVWESLIKDWHPGQRFVDQQLRGPYGIWHHQHDFQPLAGGTLVTDRIRYRLPLAPLGELCAGALVERDLQRIFDYRRQVLASIWPQSK